MATDQVKQTMNTFVGGMDTDTNDMQMNPNKYREAHNVRLNAFGEETGGTLTLIPGGTEVLSNLVGQDLFDKGYEHDCTLWAGSIGDIGIIISTVTDGATGLCWAVQKFDKNDPNHELKLVFGPCDHKIWNEDKNNLSVVASDESENVKKIYIATGIEKVMVIDICKKYNQSSIDQVIQKNLTTLNPPLFGGYTQGSIKSGMVQYCYRLSSKYGTQSQLSSCTKLIPIGNFETQKQNNDNGKNCCGVKLRIIAESDAFDRIQIYRIHQESFDTDPVVYKLQEQSFSGDAVFIDSGGIDLPITTLQSLYEQIDIIPSVIETKNNRLFAANINKKDSKTTKRFEDWDSRAYQFTTDGKCVVYRQDTEDYKEFGIEQLDSIDSKEYREYCHTQYNNINNPVIEDGRDYQRYMQENGVWYHGGIGKNVKWKFVITEIDGTTDIAKPWFPFVNMRKETWPSEEKPTVFKSYPIFSNGVKDTTLPYDYDIASSTNMINYAGKNGTTYKDPMISYGLKTLRRDEVYRYGIVLYDERGFKYQAKWIADIRTPSVYTKGFHTFYQDDERLKFYVLGIHFDVTPPEGCSRYEIVRCHTTTNDVSTITQCILQRPISNHKSRNDYFSSGIYTTANMSVTALDSILEPQYICKLDTSDNRPNYYVAQSYSWASKQMIEGGKTYFDRLNYILGDYGLDSTNVDDFCSDNDENDRLYCATSPEIAYYSKSFVDTYANHPNIRIDTLQYIYGIGDPEYNKLNVVADPNRHSVGHAVVYKDGITYSDNKQYADLYKGDMFFPFGLQYRVGQVGDRDGLNDSALLNGGSHYGFKITSECIPWVDELGNDFCDDATDATGDEFEYGITVKDPSKTLRRDQQSLRIQGCTINYNNGPNILSLIYEGPEGIGGGHAYTKNNRETMLDTCSKYVVCSYAYNKLVNWANKVKTVNNTQISSDSAQHSYTVQNVTSTNIFDYNSAGSANNSFITVGQNSSYRYSNYVIGSLGNRSIDTYDGRLWLHPEFKHTALSNRHDASGIIQCGAAYISLPCCVYSFMDAANGDVRAQSHLVWQWHRWAEHDVPRQWYLNPLRNDIAGPAGYCVLLQIGDESNAYTSLAHTLSADTSDTSGMFNFHKYETSKNDILKQFGNYKDHEAASIQGTYLTNIKKDTTPYNGSTLASIETSIYCSYGDIVDVKDETSSVTVFDGNCYIMPFEYTSMYKGSGTIAPYGKSMFHISYMVPVETSMNLYLANGFNLSEKMYDSIQATENIQGDGGEKTVDLTAHFSIYQNLFMQPVMSKINEESVTNNLFKFNQAVNNYTYNSIYSSDNSNGLVYADDLEDEHISEQNRCYYSQPKERLEHVDSYTIFRMSDYLDADEKYGEITAMKNFKGQMLFWQNTAMGLMSVQERVQVVDENGGSLSLGTGGVLERYDYLSNYYGMRKNDNAVCASPSMVYWWDSNKKRIFQYQSGQNVDLLLTNKVDNVFVNSTAKNKPVISYDTKTNEVLFDVVNETNGNLVYNERATVFTSIYDVNFARSIQFDNVVYMLTDDTFDSAMLEWNKGNASFVGRELKPSVQFVVADNTHINKVYDNHEIDMIVADSIEQNNLNDIKFEYTTPLKQHASTTGADMTMREKDYRMAIPRDNDASYGGRLRGKTMNVKITQDSSKMPFSLKYVITKYRQSLS